MTTPTHHHVIMMRLGSCTIIHSAEATVTRFCDGRELRGDHAIQPEQLSTAADYQMQPHTMNRGHDLTHSLLAAILGLQASPTLEATAKGERYPDWWREERAVLALQGWAEALGIDIVDVARTMALRLQREDEPVSTEVHPLGPDELKWWAGADEEWFHVGPCDTREQAIQEADDSDYTFEDGGKVKTCVAQASQARLNLARRFDARRFLDRVAESNEDMLSEYGEDCPIADLSDEHVADLQDRVRRAIWGWQKDHALELRYSTFADSYKTEVVDIRDMSPEDGQ